MSEQELLQDIYEQLEQYFPSDWENIVFYGECKEDSYLYEYYVDNGSGEYIKCFKLPGIIRKDLIKTFTQINQIVKAYRSTLSRNNLWTNITIIMKHTGQVKAEFDFTDLSDGGYEYMKRWKQKYLNI